MEQLQQNSAQEKCKSDEDELIEVTRMESELNPETNSQVASMCKECHALFCATMKEKFLGCSTGEVHSSSKSYDEDDDPYKWSQYNQ